MLPSAELGWELAPGPCTSFGVPPSTTINTLGLRGPLPGPKSEGRKRLVTLGDSTVFGVLVADDQVFGAVAAHTVQRRSGHDMEAVDGGVPGYSSEQARRLYDRRLRDADADFVVIATLWSDSQPAPRSDLETMFPEGERVLAPLQRSALFRLMETWIGRARGPREVEWELQGTAGPTRVPLPRYRENLEAMIDASRDDGATPVLLMLPSTRDLRRQPLEPPRPDYRETMRQVAAEHDVLLVDGAAPFFGGDPSLMADDVHPTAAGHRLLGETLAQALIGTLPVLQPL
jgi:lysophospholipase L1-like esterase